MAMKLVCVVEGRNNYESFASDKVIASPLYLSDDTFRMETCLNFHLSYPTGIAHILLANRRNATGWPGMASIAKRQEVTLNQSPPCQLRPVWWISSTELHSNSMYVRVCTFRSAIMYSQLTLGLSQSTSLSEKKIYRLVYIHTYLLLLCLFLYKSCSSPREHCFIYDH